MCVGVTVWFGWGGVVSLCRLKQCFSLHKDSTVKVPRLRDNDPVVHIGTGLFKMIVGVIHSTLQMQPHVISFYGVTLRIRFMFLLFPQVSRN